MSRSYHLDGHLPADHLLSPQAAFARLPFHVRQFTDYSPLDLWETDTRRLPRSLARLRRRARDFADRVLAPAAMELDLAPHLPAGEVHPLVADILVRAGREGFLSYFLPAPIGSMPPDRAFHSPVWQSCLVIEEFSRVCGGLMLLLSAHHLGCMPLVLSGSPRLILGQLRPIYRSCLNGDPHLVAFAITEPDAGSDVEDGHGAARYKPGLVASPVPGGFRLNGRKQFISGGDICRSLTVFAALEGEGMESWTCFHVDSRSPGFRVIRTELKMGMRASGAAELEFSDVFVPADRVVGKLRGGWAINRATLNFSRIPVASMGVGFAEAATRIAAEFACSYELGGKTLVNYQDVQLHLATMLAETRALRSLVWQEARHAWRPRQLMASGCKFHATDRAQHICEMAMDLLAGHGSLHEARIEKLFRDLRLTRIFEGTNQINRLAVIEDWQDSLMNMVPSDPRGAGEFRSMK